MKQKISIEAMMEAGMHFGHQTFRRNPKMDSYIFEARDGIHLIDLTKTLPLLTSALEFAHELATEGKQIIFVGTKKQAGPIIKQAAEACGMPYVDERWMGGLLTNFDTLKKRLKYMREIDDRFAKNNFDDMTKKERAELDKVYKTLQFSLGGLREMRNLPAAIFVVSTLQDAIAVREAKKLKLPVIAMVDTNSDPSLIDYPIPSNDDAKKAISYVAELVAEACMVSDRPLATGDQPTDDSEKAGGEEELAVKVEEGTNGN
ncbi:MAG: 30S ribosomal protein S2 [Patescibacteria group bacterium]